MLDEDLFRSDISLERTKELFKNHVMVVEIENHNYCNRTCWFCPNSYIDRISKTILMSDKIFDKIVNDLKTIDYEQVVLWSVYHEALAHDSIFERIHKMRKAVPKAFLKMFTNGDYLNPEKLRRLEDVGLDRMRVSLYLPDHKEQDRMTIEQHIEKFQKRTGLTATMIKPGFYNLETTSIQATLFVPDYFHNYISSRAGSVKVEKPKRMSTCLKPITHTTVEYNGLSMLCHETRSDVPEHRKSITGDLNNEGIGLFECYRSLASKRNHLINPGGKSGVCSKCDLESIGTVGRSQKFANILARIPGLQKGFNRLYWNRFIQANRL